MIQLKKTILTLVALLAVTTGAWATEFTSLKVGDVLHVGDAINTGTNYKVYGLYLDAGYQPATLVRANIGTNDITESETGAYYLIKGNNDFYFGIIWGDGLEGGYWPVTDTSDGISVTAITPGDYTELTFAVHEGTATPVDGFAWDKAAKTGTFTMPGGNVTLEPEYYPQATLAFHGLTAAEDAAAKTEAPLAVVADGAVTGGTLMYYVALDENFSQADAIALAETQWSADIPTAEAIEAAGTYYVWYYIKGDDEHSDTDPIPLVVTVQPEPTYNVEFAEDTPEPTLWTASPAADVKKGQTVTVTYTGAKKVIGVKAEKKGGAAGIVNPAVGQVIGSDGNNYDANATLPDGVTKVAMIAYVSGSNGLALALTEEGIYTWDNSSPSNGGKTAPEICSELNTSKAVTGCTWKLPSMDEWQQMFSANGGNEGSYTGLNNALAAAGGESSKLLEGEEYWSSSEVDEGYAWLVYLADGNAIWDNYGKHYSRYVRACLAF